MPGQVALPFFAAEYSGRRISIRRTVDYDETISSVQKAFPVLSKVSTQRISLAQVFPELGDGGVEVSRELWKDILPLVKTMQVVVMDVDQSVKSQSTKSKKRKSHAADLAPANTALTDAPDATVDLDFLGTAIRRATQVSLDATESPMYS
ncbi:unnamed protein product [Rhizoctonia solani]|uniref:Uncharacterized protein n=1 Tax=Rhizoctonia solani TaxID=456999 RepID=A0A8H3E4B8_9AGAM|nr:unnamed protein product [Rhizoctonia solani]